MGLNTFRFGVVERILLSGTTLLLAVAPHGLTQTLPTGCHYLLRQMPKCAICRTPFNKRSMAHKLCGNPDCAVEWALKEKAKRERKEQRAQAKAKSEERKADRAKKESLKTRSDWIKEAQAAFNRAIRLRDANLGCVSCEKPATWNGQWHASHYKSVGSNSALRFNLWNVHKSCSVCNNYKSGNIGEYRPRLIARVGIDRVDWLDAHPRIRSYSVLELKRMKSIFNRLCKRYERRL